MTRYVLSIVLAALVLTGCSSDPHVTDTGRYVSRYADPDYRVTCWYTGSAQGGISCLPDSQVVAR